MKILLINDYAPPLGGAEILMQALRAGLRREGHDARLFTSSAHPSEGDDRPDYQCLGTTSSFRTLLQTANPWAYWALRKVLAKFQPDVVHVALFLTQLSPLILPLLRTVPSVYMVFWYRPICPLGTKVLPDGTACREPAGLPCYRHGCLPLWDWTPLMLQTRLWRRWQGAFDLIVAHGETLRERLGEEGIPVTEALPGGVPIQPMRSPLSPPPAVAFAGRLITSKGAHVLIRAFSQVARQIPEAQLLIAGDGPERAHLAQMVRDDGLETRVRLLGHLPRAHMDNLLRAAWVQAVPSLVPEAFGLVAGEAMMRGTAVVASNTGGLAETVREGETGFLVPPGEPDALAEALFRLLGNHALAEQMGRAGREIALQRLSETVFLTRLLTLYETARERHARTEGW